MTRVPTAADFAGLDLTVALHFPDPPEATTALLLLFHGFGDAEAPFASFARAMNLPGVLAIAVRGPGVVPPLLVGDDDMSLGAGPQHFHWGDDLALEGSDVAVADPGFDRAVRLVGGRLVRDVLVRRCGWRTDDVLLFGYGQGGTFALALAATATDETTGGQTFKGLVAVGPAVPSAVSMGRTRTAPSDRLATPVLVCGAAGGNAVSAETAAQLRQQFATVTLARWARPDPDDNGMPRSRDEMQPVMAFVLPRLRAW